MCVCVCEEKLVAKRIGSTWRKEEEKKKGGTAAPSFMRLTNTHISFFFFFFHCLLYSGLFDFHTLLCSTKNNNNNNNGERPKKKCETQWQHQVLTRPTEPTHQLKHTHTQKKKKENTHSAVLSSRFVLFSFFFYRGGTTPFLPLSS